MARRGALTALQAVLAGISGGAGGYIQQQEMERRKQKDEQEKARQAEADAAGVRAEQRAIRSIGGTQVARAGEQVAGPMPSAIPLSGVGNAFAAAEKAGGPATSRGALRQEVGGESFMLPSVMEMEALASERKKASTQQESDEENRRDFETLKALYGKKGDYNPQVNYSKAIDKAKTDTGRTSKADNMQAFIDKQIADEITRMAREGKPGAYGMPNTPYGKDELATAAQNMRAALAAAFAAPGASAAGAGGVLDLSPQAAQQAGVMPGSSQQRQAPRVNIGSVLDRFAMPETTIDALRPTPRQAGSPMDRTMERYRSLRSNFGSI
jgi:hypothetical protein